jgi:uncharacterized membrane protein YcaP (DUF421 family)
MTLAALFDVNTSPLELIARGTLMYWFLLLLFRFVLRRDAGALGVADLLFVVIVADASQNALAGGYDTVAEGLILVGTLAAWNYALDWAGYRWKAVRWLTEPPALVMIDNGRIVAANLRRQFVTREDLESEMRQVGIDDLAQVRKAFMEGDGKFSFVTTDGQRHRPAARETPGAH